MNHDISVLNPELANQIAAGEVIERPASIIKELVENSLDAGASAIEVEVVGGGVDRISVRDNGAGMTPENLKLSVAAHATSKIKTLEDLHCIQSFGFRGEALASIASISRVRITSNSTADMSAAWTLFDGQVRPAVHGRGTTIEVEDVFYSVPARRKFLKSEATEWGHILQWLTRLSLARPEIGFLIKRNGATALNLPAGQDVGARLKTLQIGDGQGFYSFEYAHPEHSLHGWLQSPPRSSDRTQDLYLFVNHRFVQDKTVRSAVLSGLTGFLEKGRTPVGVVSLDVPAELVDVNVHPSKIEVRFLHSQRVYAWIQRALSDWAGSQPWVGRESQVSLTSTPRPFPGPATEGTAAAYSVGVMPSEFRRPSFGETSFTGDRRLRDMGQALAVHATRTAGVEASPPLFSSQFRVIGQWQAKYILLEDGSDLWIVDQHAAQERIRYERLLEAYRARKPVSSQPLLISEEIDISQETQAYFETIKEKLELLGWQCEVVGKKLRLLSHPVDVPQAQMVDTFRAILGRAGDEHDVNPLIPADVHLLLATQACKGAIKAGDFLNDQQVRSLCHDILAQPLSAHCPHGRPSWVKMQLHQIDHLFHRP